MQTIKEVIDNIIEMLCQELNDHNCTYAEPIKNTLKEVFEFIQKEDFAFNNLLEMSFKTRAGQNDYLSKDYPSLSLERDWFEAFIMNRGRKIPLRVILGADIIDYPNNFENKYVSGYGVPRMAIVCGGKFFDSNAPQYTQDILVTKIRLDPVPDAEYVIILDNKRQATLDRLSYRTKTIWLEKAYPFIEAYLRYSFFKYYLYDLEMAGNAYERYQNLVSQYKKNQYDAVSAKKITATRF